MKGEATQLATLQWLAGAGLLALAGWFDLLGRSAKPTHVFGPDFFALLLAPTAVGLICSGLALTFRCAGWQWLQLVPWFTAALTIAWVKSLRS